MKIVKKTGEQILPHGLRAELKPVLAFTGAGTALWTGSCELVDRAWKATDDYSTRDRLFALGIAGYLAAYGCWHAPHIARFAVPGAIVIWCVAAWWISPPTPAADDPAPLPTGAPHAFQQWLLDLIGDRPGIHLRDLYPAMRQLPGHEDRDNAQLRAALRALDIPVRRSLRLGGVAGRSGVAAADLRALPSRPGDSCGETDGDAGQSADSPHVSAVGEGVESG